MNRILAILLIVAGAVLGIYGVQKMDASEEGIEIGNLEISAKNEKASNNAIIYLVVGGVALLGGFVVLGRKDK